MCETHHERYHILYETYHNWTNFCTNGIPYNSNINISKYRIVSLHCWIILYLNSTDQFTSPSRPVDRPFRCCIGDIFKGRKKPCVCGRVPVYSIIVQSHEKYCNLILHY